MGERQSAGLEPYGGRDLVPEYMCQRVNMGILEHEL